MGIGRMTVDHGHPRTLKGVSMMSIGVGSSPIFPPGGDEDE